jgi:hypothetical protein
MLSSSSFNSSSDYRDRQERKASKFLPTRWFMVRFLRQQHPTVLYHCFT